MKSSFKQYLLYTNAFSTKAFHASWITRGLSKPKWPRRAGGLSWEEHNVLNSTHWVIFFYFVFSVYLYIVVFQLFSILSFSLRSINGTAPSADIQCIRKLSKPSKLNTSSTDDSAMKSTLAWPFCSRYVYLNQFPISIVLWKAGFLHLHFVESSVSVRLGCDNGCLLSGAGRECPFWRIGSVRVKQAIPG